MTSIVSDFKSIRRILDRQEQKAEFEEKNPPIPDTSMYGWPYGVASPLMDQMGSAEAGRIAGGFCESVTLTTAQLPTYGGLSPAVRAFVDGWEYDETLRVWRKYEI
jgi:hypothetical protein